MIRGITDSNSDESVACSLLTSHFQTFKQNTFLNGPLAHTDNATNSKSCKTIFNNPHETQFTTGDETVNLALNTKQAICVIPTHTLYAVTNEETLHTGHPTYLVKK